MSPNFKTTLETIKALQPLLAGARPYVPVKSLPASREEVAAIAGLMGLAISRNGKYGLNVYKPIGNQRREAAE